MFLCDVTQKSKLTSCGKCGVLCLRRASNQVHQMHAVQAKLGERVCSHLLRSVEKILNQSKTSQRISKTELERYRPETNGSDT